MNHYIFKTSATMKEYNRKKWWIDSGIIREIAVNAETTKEALKKYQETVKDKYYIEISDNALKNKAPMYIENKRGDVLQIGYVITAKSDFYDDNGHSSTQYIDLWVEVLKYDYPNDF